MVTLYIILKRLGNLLVRHIFSNGDHMGASNSTVQYDIHDLERAFWYAKLQADGDFLKSAEIVEEMNPDLLVQMSGSKAGALHFIQNLIAAHPQASNLPYYGNTSKNEMMSELLKARAWIDGGPKPDLDPMLARQIELAAASQSNLGKKYVENRIKKRAVQSYTTRVNTMEEVPYSWQAQVQADKEQEELMKRVRNRQGAYAEQAIHNNRAVQKAIMENQAWHDPRVKSALTNQAVNRIIASMKA